MSLFFGEAIVINNARKDPNYCPYCLRCTGLVRMKKVCDFFWRCKCGAMQDSRAIAACQVVAKFGAHHPECECRTDTRKSCDCGYAACAAALQEPPDAA